MELLLRDKYFVEKIRELGYEPTEKSFRKFLQSNIYKNSIKKISELLEISPACVNIWMRILKVRNPRGRGGNNNPEGYNRYKKRN